MAALFLECLPNSLRERIANEDPAFAEDCGFSSRCLVVIAGTLSIAEVDLLDATGTVYAGAETVGLTDTMGTPAELALTDDEETLIVSWIDAEGATRRVQVAELTLVSGVAEARIRVLDEIVRQLGPTAQAICALREHISSRRLTHEEVSLVFGENTTGVAAVQSRLVGKIAQGWQVNVDDVVAAVEMLLGEVLRPGSRRPGCRNVLPRTAYPVSERA